MPICPQCGEEAGPRGRFCPACGAALAEPARARETRKVVTILFSDVIGSTGLGEHLDAESLRRVMARYFDEMRAALQAHGGTVEKFIGDAVMAVFGIPSVHEDDALRALRAATEMRERLAQLNVHLERDFGVRLETRTGITTGEVVVGEGQSLATGDAVNVAARLEQAAEPGDILVGSATAALVRGAARLEAVAPLELKGKSEPVTAWRLLGVSRRSEPVPRRAEVPLVGRARELRLVKEAFERAAAERSCHLFTLLGAAGVGKSRLVAEALTGIGEAARVLRGRCLPYGDGITYWPLADVVRQAAGITDALSQDEARNRITELLREEADAALIAARVGAAIGLEGVTAGPEETTWAARKLFESLARERPVVLVFDDVHWAEPTFLDLIEHVAEWSRDAPILLVALARPDLLDRRPGWGGGKLNATSILLESPNDEESEQLIDELLGPPVLAPQLRQRIVETAGGNPLFVEEMLAMLLDAAGTPALEVPPTIQALLAARLDQLPASERSTLECASVVGQEFSRAALVELGGDPRALAALVRKELIRPVRSPFAGDDSFRFRHLLIRDAAYAGLAKESRAAMHERFARWLERSTGDRLQEYEEIVGYHVEQAHRYHAELGPLDEAAGSLAAEATALLGAAGERAASRGDFPAARHLLKRALALDPGRADLALTLGAVLYDIGALADALSLLERAEAAGERAVQLQARILAANTRCQIDPDADVDGARDAALAAIPELEALGDERGLAHAWRGVLVNRVIACRHGEAAHAAEQMGRHARAAGDRRLESEALFWICAADHFGPMPAQQALARCERLEADGPFAQAAVLEALGAFRSMLGDADEALLIMERGRLVYRELGLQLWYHGTALALAAAESRAGRLEAVERIFRESCAGLAEMGDTAYLSTHAASLAVNLCRQGRHDEAPAWIEFAERATNPRDVVSVMLVAQARALVLARAGDVAGAEEQAREAIELGGTTDSLESQGDALLVLADVLEAAGRHEDAAAALEGAVRLYEQKQVVPMAARTRERLSALRV